MTSLNISLLILGFNVFYTFFFLIIFFFHEIFFLVIFFSFLRLYIYHRGIRASLNTPWLILGSNFFIVYFCFFLILFFLLFFFHEIFFFWLYFLNLFLFLFIYIFFMIGPSYSAPQLISESNFFFITRVSRLIYVYQASSSDPFLFLLKYFSYIFFYIYIFIV